MCRIGKPTGPIRHIGPGPYLRDSRRKRVDFAIGAIRAADLISHKILVNRATLYEIRIERRDEIGVLGGRDAAMLTLFGALPPAVLNYIFAEHYRQDPERVASIVLVGNAASLLIIPLTLAWVL